MRDGKSSCGFYYQQGLRNRAQYREPLRGYEPPGNRPRCAGWVPLSLPRLFYHSTGLGSGFLAAVATASPITDLESGLAQRLCAGLQGRVNTTSSSRTRRLSTWLPGEVL